MPAHFPWEAIFTAAPLGALGYFILLTLMATAWGTLLHLISKKKYPLFDIYNIYGRSQIAKYLPSNVLHFAGRQMLGKKLAWQQGDIALASLLEIILLCAASMLLAGVSALTIGQRVFEVVPPSVVIILTFLGFVTLWFLLSKLKKIPFIPYTLKIHQSSALFSINMLLWSLVQYLLFFVGCTVILALIYLGFDLPLDYHRVALLAYGFAISWLIGYVTPSAPGGLGVREAVFVLLLGSTLGEANAVMIAVLFRLMTIVGDVLFFGVALVVNQKRTATCRQA